MKCTQPTVTSKLLQKHISLFFILVRFQNVTSIVVQQSVWCSQIFLVIGGHTNPTLKYFQNDLYLLAFFQLPVWILLHLPGILLDVPHYFELTHRLVAK